jgi:acyl-CoA synthetase (AMP-forming)/AMP-acid ligase II
LIKFWQGFHSPELDWLIDGAWRGKHTLILLPPGQVAQNLDDTLGKLGERPAFGLFTSGTLRRKLILYRRENFEASLAGITSFFELTKVKSVFCYPQPYHVFGLSLGYLLPMLYGKKRLVNEGRYATASHERWLAQVETGTLTLGAPAHFSDLAGFISQRKIIPPTSYSAIVGGAPVTCDLWQTLKTKLKITSPSIGYGASELSPGVTHLAPGIEPTEDNEIGIPLPGVEVSALGGAGVRVRGKNVCLAVVDGEHISTAREIVLPDEVWVRADGRLVFKNRVDLVINRGGEKFSLEAIERRVLEKFGVPAVAWGVPDARLGKELAILVERPAGARLVSQEIHQFIRTEWGRDFNEQFIWLTDKIPRNASDKLDRSACRKIAEAYVSTPH